MLISCLIIIDKHINKSHKNDHLFSRKNISSFCAENILIHLMSLIIK